MSGLLELSLLCLYRLRLSDSTHRLTRCRSLRQGFEMFSRALSVFATFKSHLSANARHRQPSVQNTKLLKASPPTKARSKSKTRVWKIEREYNKGMRLWNSESHRCELSRLELGTVRSELEFALVSTPRTKSPTPPWPFLRTYIFSFDTGSGMAVSYPHNHERT